MNLKRSISKNILWEANMSQADDEKKERMTKNESLKSPPSLRDLVSVAYEHEDNKDGDDIVEYGEWRYR